MAVTRLDIRSREPYEGGAAFGDAGSYERLEGVIHVAVDPAHELNREIVDLDLAARDGDGRIHFSADFCLLQPAEPARANRRLLLEVLNRGRKLVPGAFNRAAPVLVPTERIDPGDGFLMRQGWTVAWCGWQWDVIRSAALMGLEAPQALTGGAASGADGRPVQGQVSVRFQPNERCADHLLADRVHQPYPAADTHDPEAVLIEREWPDGPPAVVPRDRWRFARDEGGRPVADDTRIWLDGGFAPGRVYQVCYRTRICPVVGTGLLATRDTASFLRYGDAAAGNPCAGRIDHTFAFGASQSGRFLRHFLYLGLNVDEAGRQVFDGVNPHIAGARRGEFNHRFAQPSDQQQRSFGHLPPFTDDDQTDPLTGHTDGLLRRQRRRGGVPRIVYTNTAAEYWRGDTSLMHSDMRGERDLEPPGEARIYHFAGTQHGNGALPLATVSAVDGAHGANPFNVIHYAPLLRAALINLDRWVTAGEEPPPSVFPRLADGTAARAADVIAAFHTFPGAAVPAPERVPAMPRVDLGPDAGRGIGRFPPATGAPYPTYVSAVDTDGNEVGGIRLPDLTVPVASYTGWNPRHPASGGEGQILSMLGSTVPFAATAAERERSGDPRPAISERYRDREEYLARVRVEAERLAAARYLLTEDVEIVVQAAAQRYEAFAPAAAAAGAVNAGDGGG